MIKPIQRELSIFLIVGLLSVLIDFLSYRSFLYLRPFHLDSVNLAKGFGFIVGTLFAYFANRFWTFSQQVSTKGSFLRFISIYAIGLGANIAVNDRCIAWFKTPAVAHEVVLLIAFIIATGVSALLNFLGMKFFVFRAY